MKNHCEEGKILCEQFEDKSKDWGFADLDKEAAERIIGNVVNPNLKDICNHAKEADVTAHKAKQAYAGHVADRLL